MRRMLIVLAPFLGLAACAPNRSVAAAQAARQCFWSSEVTSFGDAGPKRIIANVYNQEKWELTLANGCPNANWAMKIGIISRGSQEICTDAPAELLVPLAGGGAQHCLVTGIRKL